MEKSLRGYTVKFVNPNISDPTIHAPTFAHTNCTIYSGDQDASGDSHRLAFQMNLEAGQAVLATSKQARAAHFIGFRVPSGLDNAPINRIHPSKAYAIFGYLVLTLFKQINDENSYQRYTINTLKALFAVAGYEVAEDEDQTIFNDMFHAKTYRTIFGQNFGLRKRITECIIEKRALTTSRLGSVCSYVCCILGWYEMNTLINIVETLLIPRSPLLYAPEMRAEIVNVEKALRAVLASNMPQFFRILNPPHETEVMMGANFPKLAAIATKLKGSTETNAMLGQVGQRNFFQTMDYLTHFSPADED
ncbi:unnamed protein product [Eruca vesicaria subsp. sativa]|uniref:Uncharacterized protein n=1 Tax=Eruca vesicaria subsp. sativa TaxID=29727 RepID=A0ABC8IX73_ERUVS|nr:unnamed protein product [Eruca vesicaria subsp. sativa]